IENIKKTNLDGLINKMNFYIVNDLSQSYHDDPSKPFEGIKFTKILETGKDICGAESSIAITNPLNSTCRGGQYGGFACGYGCLSSWVCGPNVVGGIAVPHELAHAIAFVEDEYGDSGSPQGSEPLIYNCSDEPTCSKWSGMSGTGCYIGCGSGSPPKFGYSNLYRPTDESIMRATPNNFTFNSPSLKAWEEALKNFQ
ncbi:hypothetical protein HY612_02375, partial [Candidatus Roizmanbacteria bacterium]|nr:hypothetical protein [Candidatus Roizmanbacteria bacterium]